MKRDRSLSSKSCGCRCMFIANFCFAFSLNLFEFFLRYFWGTQCRLTISLQTFANGNIVAVMIRFIGLFDNSTWLYGSLLYTHTCVHVTSSLPTLYVTPPQGSWTIPGHSYQLITATAHSSCLTDWLTDWPTKTNSAQLNSLTVLLITCQHGLHRKHRFSLLLYPVVAVRLLRLWKHACLWSFY
jgi:hypothetical protein